MQSSHLLIASLLPLALVGCVDPRAEFEDFATRGIDAGPDAEPSPDAPPLDTIPEIDGEFYMVVKLNVVSTEDKLVHFRTTIDYTAVTENTGTWDWSAQPLDYKTLEPVGSPLTAQDVAVNSNGTSDVPFIGVLPARANPVTNTDVDIDAVVHAQIRSHDFLCGTLDGQGGSISLDGSTFGGSRVTGSTLPPAVIRCP